MSSKPSTGPLAPPETAEASWSPKQLAQGEGRGEVYARLLRADLYRKTRRTDLRSLAKLLLLNPGYTHVFWLRTVAFTATHPALRHTLHPLIRLIYRHYQHKHSVWIPPTTQIGPGLFLEHLGDIVVNGRVIIGKNCNIANGVTIGQTNRGARKGNPRIGDNVFVGPGAKILGGVTIGNDVVIGANCVVVHDVPDHAVVVAPTMQVISHRGAGGYVNNTDYTL